MCQIDDKTPQEQGVGDTRLKLLSKETALVLYGDFHQKMNNAKDKRACEEAAVENDKENDAEELWQRTPDQAQEAD